MTKDNERIGNDESGHSGVARIASDSVIVVPLFAGWVRDKETDVRRINQFDVYELGHQLHPLMSLQGDIVLNAAFYPLFNARAAIERLLNGTPIRYYVAAATSAGSRGQPKNE